MVCVLREMRLGISCVPGGGRTPFVPLCSVRVHVELRPMGL